MQTILILSGGQSSEHTVSLRSGQSVLEYIDKSRYQVIPVGISQDGRWWTGNPLLTGLGDHWKTRLADGLAEVKLEGGQLTGGPYQGVKIDCVFSVLHGTYGEDGCMQGFLKMQHLPFVGSDALASGLAMDKDLFKRLLQPQGIPMADWITLYDNQPQPSYAEVTARLGQTLFVKPSAQGSSVGVSKVRNESEYQKAVAHAFEFDRKVLVEKAIVGREVELAILGNSDLLCSDPAEIKPSGEFYDYEAKYVNDTAKLILKADLPPAQIQLLKETAIKAYRLLGLEGFSRMDFFAAESGEIWFNEPNTLPGFTSISMYPKMIEGAGVPYPELITRLINLALERQARLDQLKAQP